MLAFIEGRLIKLSFMFTFCAASSALARRSPTCPPKSRLAEDEGGRAKEGDEDLLGSDAIFMPLISLIPWYNVWGVPRHEDFVGGT